MEHEMKDEQRFIEVLEFELVSTRSSLFETIDELKMANVEIAMLRHELAEMKSTLVMFELVNNGTVVSENYDRLMLN